MKDIYLIVIFLICIAAGYLFMNSAGGFMIRMIRKVFQPERCGEKQLWYNNWEERNGTGDGGQDGTVEHVGSDKAEGKDHTFGG